MISKKRIDKEMMYALTAGEGALSAMDALMFADAINSIEDKRMRKTSAAAAGRAARDAARPEVLQGGPREMFRRLGIGESRGYRALQRGEFPFVRKIGAAYVVPVKAFERFLNGE